MTIAFFLKPHYDHRGAIRWIDSKGLTADKKRKFKKVIREKPLELEEEKMYRFFLEIDRRMRKEEEELFLSGLFYE